MYVLPSLSVIAVLTSKRDDAIEAERRQNVNVANVLGEQTLRALDAGVLEPSMVDGARVARLREQLREMLNQT